MEIKIEDYLSNDEIKKIIIDEIKEHLRKKETLTALLSNVGYLAFYACVDKEIKDLQDELIFKVKECIEGDIQHRHIFRKKDIFEKEDSLGQKLLDQTILENKELLENKIIKSIADFNVEPEINKQVEDILNAQISSLEDFLHIVYEKQKKD